ncbi:MAG: hypothetical protein C0631_16065 [Sedimenticola sp.]|jgi:hypothetical protein|nr:MAG: hypothetical protein C0631_16065 [Sedimenticola sp.]
MVRLKHLRLDVLKPHHPSVIEFSKILAEQGECRVRVMVLEMDEKTETLEVEIEGSNLDFDQIQSAISAIGASLHSIDAVEVDSAKST